MRQKQSLCMSRCLLKQHGHTINEPPAAQKSSRMISVRPPQACSPSHTTSDFSLDAMFRRRCLSAIRS